MNLTTWFKNSGCRGCGSGNKGNIFENKYGQYLAAIQVARERKIAAKQAAQQKANNDSSEGDDDDGENGEEDSNSDDDEAEKDDEEDYVVGAADGSAQESVKRKGMWLAESEENLLDLEQSMIGVQSKEAMEEANKALRGTNKSKQGYGPPGKRQRPN